MKRITNLALLLVAMMMLSPAVAQDSKVVNKIIEIGTTDNQSMDHLDVLTNRIGGRLIGSDGYENASIWVASQFKKWGMQVEMDYVGELPVGFNRGPWFGRMLSDNGMILHFATPSYTAGTKGIQKGHVMLEPKTQAEFDRMKGKLKGSWVLITGTNSGWPIDYSEEANAKRAEIIKNNLEANAKNREIMMHNRMNPDDQKEMVKTEDEPALFYKEMCEAGILGIIQSSTNPIRALYDRKNVDNMSFDNLPNIPDIKLDEHQYVIIERMARERQRFELEFDIRNHWNPGPVKYHNVIGIIPGTKYPNEYVIMGGHLDAFDVATGGVDCGSGLTPAMEAARLIMAAGGKPQRTILVIAWAGEEFGLYGSKAWVANNPDKHDKVSNMFNRDGGPLVASGIRVPQAMYKDFEKICKPLNDINPDFPFTLSVAEPRRKPAAASGTDAGSFAVKGIPTIGFSETDPKGYDFNYGEIWHTERDLYNMSIPEYQEHTAIVTAIVVYGVANLNHLLSREGLFLPDSDSSDQPERRR